MSFLETRRDAPVCRLGGWPGPSEQPNPLPQRPRVSGPGASPEHRRVPQERPAPFSHCRLNTSACAWAGRRPGGLGVRGIAVSAGAGQEAGATGTATPARTRGRGGSRGEQKIQLVYVPGSLGFVTRTHTRQGKDWTRCAEL